MEACDDAWPFLFPVNTKQFPTYKKIIKNPIDVATIKKRLESGVYKTRGDFCDDVKLIFTNCEIFNEDDSPVGKAGYAMKNLFDTRWLELIGQDSTSSGAVQWRTWNQGDDDDDDDDGGQNDVQQLQETVMLAAGGGDNIEGREEENKEVDDNKKIRKKKKKKKKRKRRKRKKIAAGGDSDSANGQARYSEQEEEEDEEENVEQKKKITSYVTTRKMWASTCAQQQLQQFHKNNWIQEGKKPLGQLLVESLVHTSILSRKLTYTSAARQTSHWNFIYVMWIIKFSL